MSLRWGLGAAGGGNGTVAAPPAISGARGLERDIHDQYKDQWPYSWEFPPYDADQVNLETVNGVIAGSGVAIPACPANGVLTELAEFTVDEGYYFRLKAIVLAIFGTAYADGTGQYAWTLDVNIPTQTTGGAAPFQQNSYTVPYWQYVVVHKGSPDIPWLVPGRLVFKPRDQVRVKVITAAPFPSGVNNVFFDVQLIGHTWPVD